MLIRRACPHIDTTNIVRSSRAMGSIAVAKTRLFGEDVSFTSVYVPVVDARRGYWLRTEESGHISRNAIVHGDWNSVADVALDVKYAEKSSGEYSNSHGSAIASLLAHRGLTDLFRLLNGEARQYTRQGNTVYTQIDRMYAPKYNSKWRWRQVQHTNWFPELNSDHMPVCALVDTIQPNKSSQQDARIDPRYLEHQEVRQTIKDMPSRSQRLQNTTATERWEAFKQQATTFLLDYTRRQKTRKQQGSTNSSKPYSTKSLQLTR